MAEQSSHATRNVVLVHGGFVDGSGWEAVYRGLRKRGFTVSIVQNPTTSLSDDVAATRRVLDQQEGSAVLVGHSYGGAVITEAGNHPKVAGLVYIAAALQGTVSQPAWKSKPSWYLVATDDRMIPPGAQWLMAKRAGANTIEAGGSHAIYVSQPQAVIRLVAMAAKALTTSPAAAV